MKSKVDVNQFVVNNSPYAFWDPNLKEDNLEFLNSINPDYYYRTTEILMNQLEGDDKYFAALSIRLTYSNALETLFSLLCTTIQAPFCPLGWMLSYKNHELRLAVEKISKKEGILSHLNLKKNTWDELAEMTINTDNIEQWVKIGFGKFWEEQAIIFLDDNFTKEYNSIKHGLRIEAREGVGFKFSNITDDKNNQKSITFNKSSFGSKYFSKEELVKKNKINFKIVKNSTNWYPYQMALSIRLIYMSINNILVYLKKINGSEKKDFQIIAPHKSEEFNVNIHDNDSLSVSVLKNSYKLGTVEKLFTKDDIIKAYKVH
jgi:hypothetical protein